VFIWQYLSCAQTIVQQALEARGEETQADGSDDIETIVPRAVRVIVALLELSQLQDCVAELLNVLPDPSHELVHSAFQV
jgi:hypothetical protein